MAGSIVDTNSVRAQLAKIAEQKVTVEYNTLADQLGISSPLKIQKLSKFLEACQEDDALLNRPQLVSVVVQKNSPQYPRAGFFLKLKELGIYAGKEDGPQAQMWHQNELERVYEYYQRNS